MKYPHARKRVALIAAALAGIASVTVITADAASAAGVTDVTDSAFSFGVKVSVGDSAACSGALVTPWWFVTAKSCFADATGKYGEDYMDGVPWYNPKNPASLALVERFERENPNQRFELNVGFSYEAAIIAALVKVPDSRLLPIP